MESKLPPPTAVEPVAERRLVSAGAHWRRAVRVRLRTLVALRWLAVVGQSAALAFAHWILEAPVPLGMGALAIAASIWLNVALLVVYPVQKRLNDGEATLYLAWDLIQLSVLLMLTGGLENPFAVLMLVPVTISASVLHVRSTIVLGLLALAMITLMTVWHLPLPWAEGAFHLPELYVAGTWFALVLSMGFMAVYTARVAMESRRMSDALAATQLALARENRFASLGALAAATAHELGTPLSTIAVVSRELANELGTEGPLAEDAHLLVAEARRCREILAQLGRRPDGDDSASYSVLPLGALVQEAVEAYRSGGKRVAVHLLGDEPQPMVRRSIEIRHGLGNLVDNALRHAERQVDLELDWDPDRVRLALRDDGEGFDPLILDKLGEPYVTTRPTGEGLGLGVFIAKTLLEQTGAEVAFSNLTEGGAEVAVEWPRAVIDLGEAADGQAPGNGKPMMERAR